MLTTQNRHSMSGICLVKTHVVDKKQPFFMSGMDRAGLSVESRLVFLKIETFVLPYRVLAWLETSYILPRKEKKLKN
jgi:hypothetical protein